MDLTVIIPVYNVEKYLPNCLDSLLNQESDLKNIEIIIVNDGSTDNSLLIAKSYKSKLTNLQIINQYNQGVGVARNNGLDLAKGKYVYFIDPDDYLAENVLLPILKIATTHNLDILGFNSKRTKNYEMKKSGTDSTIIPTLSIMEGDDFIGKYKYKNEVWWYIIKRSFLMGSGIHFIEGRWMEDAIFTTQLLLESERTAFVPWDVHRHVNVPESAMNSCEPTHYLGVIYDNANAAEVFDKLIQTQRKKKANPNSLKRLKARQHSFVFFLTVRAYKSNMTFNELSNLLGRLKKYDSYPITNFIGLDYNKIIYRILVIFFNNNILLKLSFKSFRLFILLKSSLFKKSKVI